MNFFCKITHLLRSHENPRSPETTMRALHILDIHTCAQVKSEFDAAGVKVVAVGPGKHTFIKPLASRTGWDASEIFVDSDCVMYRGLGLLKRQTGKTTLNEESKLCYMDCSVMCSSAHAWCCYGFQGNVLQQGGSFMIEKGKGIVWCRKDRNVEDHATAAHLLQIATGQPPLQMRMETEAIQHPPA